MAELDDIILDLHAAILWFTWTVFALTQVLTARYGKAACLGKFMLIHRISGTLITLLTLLFGGYEVYYKIKSGGFRLNSLHDYFAFPLFVLTVFIMLGGVIAKRRLDNSEWNTASTLMLKRGHKIGGAILLILSWIATSFGLYYYLSFMTYADLILPEYGYIQFGAWAISFFIPELIW